MWDPTEIRSESELENILSEPYPEDLEAVTNIRGGLLILGSGGKMGPTLVQRAVRSFRQAGISEEVVAVSRFGNHELQEKLRSIGARIVCMDLLEKNALDELPQLPNVIFMAGMKFGSSGNRPRTWAMNSYLPGRIAEYFKDSQIVAFSTGNVYPLVPVDSGGCREIDPVGPVGEYAQSCLGRERILEHFALSKNTPVCILRLNYAVEARYGILVDIANKILADQPIVLSMGYVNLIWQGDANSVCLRAFDLCGTPATILNLTGPETLSIRYLAEEMGRRLGRKPRFEGKEEDNALLSDASKCHQLFGAPKVSLEKIMDLVVCWIQSGGPTWGKPTKYEVRNGSF